MREKLNLISGSFLLKAMLANMTLPSIDSLMRSNHIEPSPFPYFALPPLEPFKSSDDESEPMSPKDDSHSVKKPEIVLPRINHFTQEEDEKLNKLVSIFGVNSWNSIAQVIGSKTARQCRDRWFGCVNPKGVNNWTVEEDIMLVKQYSIFGAKWKKIAMLIPGRSVNSIRNRWKLLLKNTEKHALEQSLSQYM